MLESPDKNYRSVSYGENVWNKFGKTAQNKLIMKITVLKRKQNYFDRTKTDIKVADNKLLKKAMPNSKVLSIPKSTSVP